MKRAIRQFEAAEYTRESTINEKRVAVTNMWNRASIQSQLSLIRQFVKNHGRKKIERQDWMDYLAEEFAIPGDNARYSEYRSGISR